MEASGLKTPDMSTSSLEEPNYWPHSEQDINEVANTLRSGRESTALLPVQTNLRDTTELPRGKPALPEELIRIILREAEYFLRLSNSKEAFVQCQQETAWQPYLESKPLSRRLPRVDIAVTGHDQGWASDSSVAYSFYDLGSISGPGSELTRGPRLFGNEPANRNKQLHQASFYPHPKSENDVERWMASLAEGDRICILPAAMYPGWQCFTYSASIVLYIG